MIDNSGPAGVKDRPALRRCIAIDPDVFAAEHWSTAPLLSPAATLPADFADLAGLAMADEIVSRRGLRTPFARMAKDGVVADPTRFTGPGGTGAEIADQVLDEKVLDLFADGATLVLQGLHRLWPPLTDFAAALSADLGHPTQVNAYVTPPSNRGFDAHYDTHDVFVLQVAGRKRWRIHSPVHPDPLISQPWTDRRGAVAAAARAPAHLDVELAPGDALYLPRGWIHSAEALGGVSMHLTVGVLPVTRFHVVEALLGSAGEDPELRRSLPMGVDVADPEAIREHAAATVAQLHRWLDPADPEAVSAALRRRVWPAVRPGPISPIAQAGALAEVHADSRLAPRAYLRWRIEDTSGDTVLLRYADRWLRVPRVAAAALRAVLVGDVSRVGDLPGLEPAEQLVLARRLLREAVAVPA